MAKLFISLLTVRVVTGINCYLTDGDNPGLNEHICATYEHSCMAFAVRVSSYDGIIRGRACSVATPSEDLDLVEKIICQESAEKLSVTHCSVGFCFSDYCNEYRDLDPKPMSDFDSSHSHDNFPSSVLITCPHKALLLFTVFFWGIK